MSLTVCACVVPENMAVVKSIVEKEIGSIAKNIVYGTTPESFAAVKKANEPIALLVETGLAHPIIKDLCDDHASAKQRVKFIYSLTAGVDAYKLSEMQQELATVPVHNAQGCYSVILGEHVLFSMMYFNRFPWRLVASKNAKKWDRFNMVELQGQKAVVVGYGDIGRACGSRAAAMGMDVTGIRRSGDGKKDSHGVTVRGNDALSEVLREADFVIGVLPGTPDTKHFFNMSVFKQMKPTAVFINIGRGATQNEADIVEALDKGIIRGAALDVFEQEPLPESSPLWNVPDDKLLLSAHCADWTDNLIPSSAHRFAKIFKDYASHGKSDEYKASVAKGY